MFLKQKNNPNGSFLKLKARLVAGGDQQDKSLYEDLSSPTVSTSAVFTLLAIAAHEERRVSVVDISGAYLNADMALEIPVHMRLDRTMTDLIIDIDPTHSKYTDARGGVKGALRVPGCGMRIYMLLCWDWSTYGIYAINVYSTEQALTGISVPLQYTSTTCS